MSEIRDFKKIADEAMCDINVTEAMKDEVMSRSRERKRHTGMPLLRVAAAAACGVLIFGILHLTGTLKPNDNIITQDDQPNIFSATVNQPESAQQPIDGMLNEPRIQRRQPALPEEAARSFGEGFLIPSYIPDGFKPIDIYVSGTDKENADSVIFNYSAGERSFQIMEQRSTKSFEFPDLEAIDINGAAGYVNSQEQYTEVYWFSEEVRYSVSGMLAREDAIMIARSMEPAGEQ